MTTRAVIDTPWLTVIDGTEVRITPKLGQDPAFEAAIQGRRCATGIEGVEVEPGKVLYGGNYAASTGIRPGYSLDPSDPDYDPGRLGGSGNPDSLVIEITFDEVAHPTLLADIDAVADYNVYESRLVEEEPTP